MRNILQSQTIHKKQGLHIESVSNIRCNTPRFKRTFQKKKKKRELSIRYSFQKVNAASERVCKAFFFFEKALGISWGPIQNAIKGGDSSGAFVETDKKGGRPI